MKRSFRIFSILLVFALIISAFAIPVSAAIPPQKYGDVNLDAIIDVTDATQVQRYLAKKSDSVFELEAADVDSDAFISVMDATLIQKYVALLLDKFPAGEYFLIDKYFYSVTADYDNDKAITNAPVTFFVDADINPAPATAKLYIDDVLVAQTQEQNEKTHLFELVYTFEKAGTYGVKITVEDKWGNTDATNLWSDDGWKAVYTVKDAPTNRTVPVITSVTRNSIYSVAPVFTTNVQYGTQPYKYSYALYRNNEQLFITDYLDTNTLKTADYLNNGDYLHYGYEYTLYVVVEDANGEIACDEYDFMVDIMLT